MALRLELVRHASHRRSHGSTASLPAVPPRLPRGYADAVSGHVAGGRSRRRFRQREQGEAGGEPVEEVAAADRAELAGAEARRRAGSGPEELVDDAGVVVGIAEEALPPPVAGEEERGVGLGRRPAGRAGPRRRSRRRGPGTARCGRRSTSSPTAMAPLRWSAPSTFRTRKSPRPNSSLVLVDDAADVQARAASARAPRRWRPRPSPASRCRAGLPPSSRTKLPVGLGHDVGLARPAGSPARRRCGSRHRRRSSTPTAPRVGDLDRRARAGCRPGCMAADASPPITWSSGRSSLTRSRKASTGKRERVGEAGAGRAVGDASGQPISDGAVGGRDDLEADGREPASREPGGEEGEGGGVLDLAAAADRPPPRCRRAGPRGRGGPRTAAAMSSKAPTWCGRGEADHEVAAARASSCSRTWPHDLADGLGRRAGAATGPRRTLAISPSTVGSR